MQVSEYDTKISEAESEKNKVFEELETIVKQYAAGSVPFFQSEFVRLAEKEVTTYPENTQALGLEKLREMKREIKELIDSLPDVISQHFDKNDLWEHRQSLPEGLDKETLPAFDLRQKLGDKVGKELHYIMGHIGQILQKYGYAKSDVWENVGNKSLRYRYSIENPNSDDYKILREIIIRYADAFTKYIEAHIKVLKSQTAKQQSLARDLWNEA